MSTNKVLASPPAECCVRGVKHSGTPSGSTISLGGMETYVSEPKSGAQGVKRVILFFADVYGPLFLNNQLIQDYFASLGFIVLGPDYFFGNPVHLARETPNFDQDGWMNAAKDKTTEILPSWLKAAKEKYGTDTKYSVVGYCFGAPHTLKLAASDEVVAAALAHPAFLNEDHFRNIKQPLLLSCAEDDFTFPTPSRRIAEDILVEKKATYHFQVFSGVSHGFAIRGDPNIENQRWAKEESARGIVGWFDRFSQ
ncbi:hypothetical protein JAAARDRAFT_41412 [Jaapia argillacea MUCL 33604]|uniref:Dienelactone hydrolase domain-containing protein n=1 Tax=Jaapia argillacea MUCL 33604 TaxID=933084 RepID=A0A067PJD4_9AGAM|nr:hypothetical protein JAAARDRAFT_41412 [Jaapia argillacea MUCL 33604]